MSLGIDFKKLILQGIHNIFCIYGLILPTNGASCPLSLWILPCHLFSLVFSGTPIINILNISLSESLRDSQSPRV